MKKFIVILSVMAICSFNVLAKELKIAIVSVPQVIETSEAFKEAQEIISKKAKLFQEQARKKEEVLSKKYRDLEGKKSVLAQAAFNKEQKELTRETEVYQKETYMQRGAVEKASSEVIQKIKEKVLLIVTNIATKNKYTIVIEKMATIYSKSSTDITQQVVSELNKQLPEVMVKF